MINEGQNENWQTRMFELEEKNKLYKLKRKEKKS